MSRRHCYSRSTALGRALGWIFLLFCLCAFLHDLGLL